MVVRPSALIQVTENVAVDDVVVVRPSALIQVTENVAVTDTPNPVIDSDGDGFFDDVDNCVRFYNADQLDTNGDGIGDACDFTNVDSDLTLSADHIGQIRIVADNITLDCQGHEVVEPNPVDAENPGRIGILLDGVSGVTVKKCIVRDFWTGIWVSGGGSNVLSANRIVESIPPTVGWTVRESILVTGSDFNRLVRNVEQRVNGDGVVLVGASFNRVENNRAGGPGDAFSLLGANNNVFLKNVAIGPIVGMGEPPEAGNGFYIHDSHGNTFFDNRAIREVAGFRVQFGSMDNVIEQNQVVRNTFGILICPNLLPLNTIADNTFRRTDVDISFSYPRDPLICS